MEEMRYLVAKTLENLRLTSQYRSHQVILLWQDIVGGEIASNAMAVSMEQGVLTVNASSSAWMHHLFMLKNEIMGKINNYIGAAVVKDIRFRAGAVHVRKDEDNSDLPHLGAAIKYTRLTKEEVAQADKLVASVADDGLKRTLRAIICKNKAYSKIKQQEGWQPCADCGVLRPSDKERCLACDLHRREQQERLIISYLQQAPWQKYHDVNKQVPCRLDEYAAARQIYMGRLIQKVRSGQADKNEETALVMMATGRTPLTLTDGLINQQLEKFRRKFHVFTSGS